MFTQTHCESQVFLLSSFFESEIMEELLCTDYRQLPKRLYFICKMYKRFGKMNPRVNYAKRYIIIWNIRNQLGMERITYVLRAYRASSSDVFSQLSAPSRQTCQLAKHPASHDRLHQLDGASLRLRGEAGRETDRLLSHREDIRPDVLPQGSTRWRNLLCDHSRSTMPSGCRQDEDPARPCQVQSRSSRWLWTGHC